MIIPSKVTNTADAIEYTVTGLNKSCFSYSEITSVFIPNTVTKIDTSAFNECRKLETLTFEPGNNMTRIFRAAFQYCSKLTDIALPDNITVIEDWAFLECSKLKSIKLPNQITSIYEYAFRDLPALETLICPVVTPPTLVGSAFYATDLSKVDLYVPKGALSNYNTYPWTTFKGVLAIGSFKAGGLNYIVTDDVAKTVKVTNMLYYAPVGGSLIIPSQVINPADAVEYTVTGINRDCFSYSTITSAFIPNTISKIDSSAFHQCTLLETLTFESGSSMTRIFREAFGYCNKLTNIVLPDNITTIEEYAFLSSATLKSVTLPNQNITILPTAFMDLPAFEELICLSATPPTSADFGSVFYLTPIVDATLYVPQGAKSTYELISPWNTFLEIVEMLPTDVKNTERDDENIRFSRLNNIVTIQGLSGHHTISVYDITGKILERRSAISDLEQFYLSKGFYIVKVDNIIRKISL